MLHPGWGTFVCFAAANYKAKCLGVTISEQGCKYANQQIVDKNVRSVFLLFFCFLFSISCEFCD